MNCLVCQHVQLVQKKGEYHCIVCNHYFSVEEIKKHSLAQKRNKKRNRQQPIEKYVHPVLKLQPVSLQGKTKKQLKAERREISRKAAQESKAAKKKQKRRIRDEKNMPYRFRIIITDISDE